MRKLNIKYIIVIILLIIAIVLGIISINMKKENLNFFEKFIKDSTYVVGNVISSPVRFIKKNINKTTTKDDLYNKYIKLKEEYDSIECDKARIDELKKENKTLKEMLDIKSDLEGYKVLNATVINRNVGYFYDTLSIDKGSHSGIKPDMAVVTSKGLIGKVIKTSTLTSTVKLLSSDSLNMKISVKIKVSDEYYYGLLTGYDKDKKTYIIEGISNNIDIPNDSVVTTTGMSEIFPSGILIGKVSESNTDNFELSKIIYVKTDVNYDNIEYVTVLKRES